MGGDVHNDQLLGVGQTPVDILCHITGVRVLAGDDKRRRVDGLDPLLKRKGAVP